MFLLHSIELFWCTYKLEVYQQWEKKGTVFTVSMDWHGYRHTTCTCNENCKATISQATRQCWWDFLTWQLAQLLGAWLRHTYCEVRLCAGQHCLQRTHYLEHFCRSLLLPSGEVLKSKWEKNFSTSQFDIRVALRSSMVNTTLDAWWYRTWRVGVSVPHQQVKVEPFMSSISLSFSCGNPQSLMVASILETFEVLRGYVLKRYR